MDNKININRMYGKSIKKILTVQELKDIYKDKDRPRILATGTGAFSEIIHATIKWVAVIGNGYYDWTIYYGTFRDSEEEISKHGDKVFTESIIRKLVPCTDEVYGLYRF